jgi:molecular chaperone HtpG
MNSKQTSSPDTDKNVIEYIGFIKETLGDAVLDVRASDRLTDSVACLVAPEVGPDRQLEKLLAGAGRLPTGGKPILEVNSRHDIVAAVAGLGSADEELKQDVAHFLLDEARILEGDRPLDAKQFCDRLARLIRLGIASKNIENKELNATLHS